MVKTRTLSIVLIFCLLVSLIIPITTVYAESKNEVTLNFKGGTIHDGYVEYDKIAKVQLFKGEDLVADISNNMVIDLNEAEYKFVIEETEDTSVAGANTPIRLNINNWYYPMTKIEDEAKSTFKLDSSKFNDTLDVEFKRTNVAYNLTIKNVYDDISSKGVIDLTNSQEYVIDFSKTDELTEGLKSFADYRNKFDNTDKNLVIYGHNMRDDSMFGSLKWVINEDWYNNEDNKYITLITENETQVYEVFSVYQIEKEDYYIQTEFSDDNNFEQFVNTIKKRSIKEFNTDVSKDDNILTLSTCANNNKYRVVLHAKKI